MDSFSILIPDFDADPDKLTDLIQDVSIVFVKQFGKKFVIYAFRSNTIKLFKMECRKNISFDKQRRHSQMLAPVCSGLLLIWLRSITLLF